MTGEELRPHEEMSVSELKSEALAAIEIANQQKTKYFRQVYLDYAESIEKVIQQRLMQSLCG